MDEQTQFATEAEVLADLARRSTKPHQLDPTKPHSLLLRDGETVETIDLQAWLSEPRRRTGLYIHTDAASFLDYVGRHRDPDHTSIWVDQPSARIEAVINDNGLEVPGWKDHRAALRLVRTREWQHWKSKDGSYMDQENFADHLQEGILEITSPDSATMLEIAQSIQGKTSVDWRSASRLDNGAVGFAYQEEIEASAGRAGNLEVPATFTLAVSPFDGEEAQPIDARLRYRIRQGKLLIGYKLERPDDLEQNVLGQIVGRLRERSFEHVYTGTPPA